MKNLITLFAVLILTIGTVNAQSLVSNTSNISTTVETRSDDPNSDGTNIVKEFGQTVELSWENLVSGDQISINLDPTDTLPVGWKLQYRIDGSPYQELPIGPTNVQFVPQSFPNGSTNITYRVVVPLYEAPQTVILNPTYEILKP